MSGSEIIGQVGNFLKTVLPGSPVRALIESQVLEQDWIRILNWFIPVGQIIAVFNLWLAAVITYYLISGILRFAKIIS